MPGKETRPMVSVVIPVYRTEDFLEDCVASVLEQDYENLEILLVDDGSPDGCPGLGEAGGEFVLFLDSDDLLNGPGTVGKLMDAALGEQADVAAGSYRRFQGERFGPVNRHHLRGGAYAETADFRLRAFLTEGHLIWDWGKVYRKAFLLQNELWCGTQLYMEDKLRNMMLCACEPRYAFVDDCVNLYRIRPESITRQRRDHALMRDWIYVAETFRRYLDGRPERFEDLLAFHVFSGIFTIGRQPLEKGAGGCRESAALLREYGKNELVRRMARALARGKYLKGVRSPAWRGLVRAGSLLFCLRAYRLTALGILLLRGLGTERKESRLRSGEP